MDNKSGPVKTGPTGVVDTPLLSHTCILLGYYVSHTCIWYIRLALHAMYVSMVSSSKNVYDAVLVHKWAVLIRNCSDEVHMVSKGRPKAVIHNRTSSYL